MPGELNAWLRQQRQDRGWPVPEMARRLRDAARDSGDKGVPDNDAMCRNIRRWETGPGGLSERYKLHYCNALGVAIDQFGPRKAAKAANGPVATSVECRSPAPLAGTPVPYFTRQPPGAGLSEAGSVAYRGMQDRGLGGPWGEREVMMAAHEGSEHAARAERRDIGDATLDQFRADVTWLSHAYITGEPLSLFQEMSRVRARLHAALDLRLWPRDAADLYFLLGALNGLMAHAAHDLGYPRAADELARAGWAYSVIIDHKPLMGFLRGEQASVAYYQGRPRQARDLAKSGLVYLPRGIGAARLHCQHGMAAAKLGYAQEANAAIADAQEARDSGQGDDLHNGVGGQFGFSPGRQSFMTGTALCDVAGGETGAITELRTAIRRFETGPAKERSYGCESGAYINLALTRLRVGELDAADLTPVFGLPTERRISQLPRLLAPVRSELARPRYQGSPQARDLDEQIEQFCRETAASDLHSLSGEPG
jgi:hypothetical protein